jgi:hypothetical protein
MFILDNQTMSENKQELEDLEARLRAILSIVEKYKKDGGVGVITHRIQDFTKYVGSPHLSTVSHILPCFPVPSLFNCRWLKCCRSSQS